MPREGPLLLVSNHLGMLDPVVISARLPREVRFTPKAEIFTWPVIGWLVRLARAVPIRRGESDREAIRRVCGLLAAGECVLVFPEGTYMDPPDPAAMIPVKSGAALLALRTGAAVLPVGLSGTEKVWSLARGWRPWHRPRVRVVFGEPYHPAPPPGLATKATYFWVAEDMARRIAALVPEAYQGSYAGAVSGTPATGEEEPRFPRSDARSGEGSRPGRMRP
ncbi:MAG: 1-acyl-sn-glycerol-3-phosphate acyltransferase [Ktedonobacterales bacterium]|nr:1-acyl-sn-glycerol-3-phosphate acyltransferase [Ktedonobacterales bacterium]